MSLEPIKRNRISLNRHAFQSHSTYVSSDLTEEDLTNPDLFQMVANKFNIGDELRLVAEDFSFYAVAIVTNVRGMDVSTRLIQYVTFDEGEDYSAAPVKSHYEVVYKGPVEKHCVIDTRDGTVVKNGIPKKAEAEREMSDYIAAMNR